MNTTAEEIRGLIAAKLSALTKDNGDPLFGEVFEYANGDFTKYPVAVVLPTGGSTGSEVDTHRIERTFSFQVTLYQEQSQAGKTKQEADDIMIKATDKIIIAFDQDPDLSGAIEKVRVVTMDYNFRVAAGTYLFATFQVDCVVIVPNY